MPPPTPETDRDRLVQEHLGYVRALAGKVVQEVNSSSHHSLIIDCPAGGWKITRAALLICDICLLPVLPGPMDLSALVDTVDLLKKIQASRKGKPRALAFLNKMR